MSALTSSKKVLKITIQKLSKGKRMKSNHYYLVYRYCYYVTQNSVPIFRLESEYLAAQERLL